MCVCVSENKYAHSHVYSAWEGQMGASDHMVLELQIVISCPVCRSWELNLGSLFKLHVMDH